MKDYSILEKWIDDYNGAAIYSLVDENGKRYIGQAIHLQQRLETHRRVLNRAYKGLPITVIENENLLNAASKGKKFKVEILLKIPWYETTVNMLRYYENYYFQKYGGYNGTYNIAPIYPPVWDCEYLNKIKVRNP
jgi:predicted GIY-YIG superfamily endonuclease